MDVSATCLFVAAAAARDRWGLDFADALNGLRDAFALARPWGSRPGHDRDRLHRDIVRPADPLGDTLEEPVDHLLTELRDNCTIASGDGHSRGQMSWSQEESDRLLSGLKACGSAAPASTSAASAYSFSVPKKSQFTRKGPFQ